MTETRKLAAIMFTDIVGYSAIMSKNEKLAMEVLEKNRKIHKDTISKHHGQYIKEIGDGTLSIFQSSVDAVNCALGIQKACCTEQAFQVRIGIHIGDIIFRDNDVFGDGVNVASRIESTGEPGGIYFSEKVYDDIRNKTDLRAEFIGEKQLKNIDYPVKVYALRVGGPGTVPKQGTDSERPLWIKSRKYAVIITGLMAVIIALAIIFWIDKKDSRKPDENLIAVANFENRTGDESLDPVGRMAADWITEGIAATGLMSVVPSIVLESIDQDEGKTDIRDLAKKTRASTIITGEFFKTGSNLQFHANLIDAGSGRTLGPIEHVEGPADDPSGTIEILIQKVMGSLAAQFDQQFSVFSDRKLNPPLFQSYQEFLKGQELYYATEPEEASKHFIKAYTIDTSYLLPVIWARESCWYINDLEKVDSLQEIIDRNKDELTLGEKYLLEYCDAWKIGNWESVYQATKQVARYNQLFKYEEGRSALYSNRLEEAIDNSLKAGPDTILFKALYWYVVTTAYHMLGDHRKELKAARESREKYPGLYQTLWYESRSLAAMGRMRELEAGFNESLNIPEGNTYSGSDGYYYGIPGELMTRTALELRAHGYLKESKWAVNEALTWFSRQPDTRYLTERAEAYYVAGEWEKSHKLFIKLLTKDPDNMEYLGYLGCIAAHQGNNQKADEYSQQLKDNKYPRSYGYDSYWLACIAAIEGDKELAVQHLRNALKDGYLIIDLHAAMDLELLVDYPLFQELIKPKK